MTDSSTPGMIEGLERLKIPQSSFTLNRRTRPPAPIDVYTGAAEARVPLNPMKLHKHESKGGIRGIFNRNKAEKSVMTPTSEERVPMSAYSEMSIKTINYESLDKNTTPPQQTASTVPSTPSRPATKSSRMNLRSRNATESKSSPKSTRSQSRPTRQSATWDPPPLFQAYPQAIKHAQLATSTLSADSIIRISGHRRHNSITEYNTPSATSEEKGVSTTAKKTEKANLKHNRQVSGSISKAVMMIVTSGHILQYSNDGSFDRLPEKMMLLGKDSVAFASDVIPGKHWVLQISQSMDAEGKATSDSRSLLSRLAFRGADYRRTATSLLLILDSAEEMDSWMAVVRREIEALGGKKYVSDVVDKPSDKLTQLKQRPSHRYLIQKSPDEFSNPASPTKLSFEPLSFESQPWDHADSTEKIQPEDSPLGLDWVPPTMRQSINHQSATNSIASHDEETLDELKRNSAHLQRYSYMSSGQRTSLESSPTRESSVSNCEDTTPKVSIDEPRIRPNATAINERRRSMQTVSLLAIESQQTTKIQRHSTYGPSPTPNFSVPNSSSRRFSAVKTPAAGITPPRSTEPIPRGVRRSPPPAITVVRPLSPVVDHPSPNQENMNQKHEEPAINTIQQVTASMIDIAPRSPLPPPSPLRGSHTPDKLVPQRTSLISPPSPSYYSRPVSMVETRRQKPVVSNTKRNSLRLLDTRTTQKVDAAKDHVAPLTTIANTKTKLRRPLSMQIRPSFSSGAFAGLQSRAAHKMPISSTNQISQANQPPSLTVKTRANSPALKSTKPSAQRLKQEKTLRDRRSLPFLAGPPPAPPPNCALPPLPPGSGVRGDSSASMRLPVLV